MLGLKSEDGQKWGDVEFEVQGVVIFVKKSKTNQTVMGRRIQLSSYSIKEFCPLHWGKKLCRQQGGKEDQVFRHRNGAKVTAYQLPTVLRKALGVLGVEVES